MIFSTTFIVQLSILIFGLIWLYIFSTGLFVVSLEPGFLDFDNLPDTNFSCVGKVIGGYYADLETNCQMFHVCTIGQLDEPMDIRFLCLNGTVFDQETRVCERIDEVDCSKSEKFYSLNLELYGNTAPPILEENPETESPIIEKSPSSTTTTTTTTTTTRPTTTTTARTQYFTSSIRPVTPSPYHKGPSPHHFSLEQSPNFTPEEINISLNPGAPPNIRTKTFEFPQHNPYSVNSNKKTVTTSSSVFKSGNNYHESIDNSRISSSTTESERNSFNPSIQNSQNNFKYNFNYHDTRPRDFNPSRTNNYQYHHNFANFRPPVLSSSSYNNNPYRSSTQRNEYLPVSRKNFEVNHPSSTSRSFFLQPIKSQSQQYFRTEKPDGNQLPVPVLPTISPIVFSSPAPFSLSQHVETKRYTDEHELPPRIIISASASVSDANGRTLNYSLGTIGAAQILPQPPASYDDYKEEDVVLDPFYHDVPKIQNNGKRTKRDVSGNGKRPGQSNLNTGKTPSSEFERSKRTPQNINPSDIIKSEEEAVEVLKFLFDWYKKQEKSTPSPINIPVNPELISNINDQLSQRTYVPEDYEDDQTGTLKKTVLPKIAHQEIHSTDYSPKTTSLDGNLLQQASRGPSININSKAKVAFDMRSNPISSNYGENTRYEEKSGTYFNDYPNPSTPTYQESRQSSGPKSRTRGRPYRGRHRFTFPYATTPSQKGLIEDEQSDYSRIKVQNPSLPSYEEFYEQTKNNDDAVNNYNVNIANQNSVSQSGGGNREYSDYAENREPNLQYNTQPLTSTTTEEPVLQTLEDAHEQQTEVTEELTEKQETTTTQNYDDSVIYAATTNDFSLDDQSNQSNYNINPNSSYEHPGTIVATTPDYTKDEINIEFEKDESPKTTSQVNQISTEPYNYIDTYEYTDDNYEPATFNQNSEERRLEKNEDIIRGIIHEETHVNVDFTETPGQSIYDKGNQSPPSVETSNYNYSNSSDQYSTEQSPSNKSNFKLSDKNVTSFGEILDSLRNFQKYEQEIYNYQNNLTEIKDYKPMSHLTTTSEELTTPSSTSNWETTTLNHQDYSYQRGIESKGGKYETLPINTTSKQEKDNDISNETEEESSSSIRYFTVATDSYETKEPHLFTSKPYYTETKNSDSVEADKSSKYKVSDTDFAQTTPFTTEQTTYSQNEKINDSTEDLLSTIQVYEIGVGRTESANDSFELEINHDNQKTTEETITKKNDELVEYTTGSSEDIGEIEDEFVSSSPKSRYRGRNRSRQRPSEFNRGRIENMPVSNSYRESSGRRRNSRRRQQNKPHYNSEPQAETQMPITTTPSPITTTTVPITTTPTPITNTHVPITTTTVPISFDGITSSELSTISDSVTEDIININKFVLNDVTGKSSYESLPSTHLLNSTPKGFYITKTKQEVEYVEKYPFTTDYKKDSFLTSQFTTQNDQISTEQTIVPQSTQITVQPQVTENYSEATSESDILLGETTSTTSPTVPSDSLSNIYIDSETEKRNDTNTVSTDTTSEGPSQRTLSDEITHTTTELFSSTIGSTEENTNSYIKSTNPLLGTEEESSEISTNINTKQTATEATRMNTFVPTTVTYSTLNISEIEAATNSIVTTQDTDRLEYKDNYMNDEESLKHIEESTASTESTTDSSLHSKEWTTDYQTENIDYTTQAYTRAETEIYLKNEETTRGPSTKINIVTEVHSAEDQTKTNEDGKRKSLKSSPENEILNEQNRHEAQINRDGRKYDRTQNKPNRPKSKNRFSPRHRFSSINVTPRNSGSKRPNQSYKHRFGSTSEVTEKTTSTSAKIEAAADVFSPDTPKHPENQDEETLTEISLPKNVKPTLATVKSKGFSTTPMLYKVELRKEKVNKHYIFNCFGKTLNQFYSDPRDCRLFHYCTNGYSKNQLLDMKFVCDLGTHFDDEKLVCTREIPKRCS